MEQGTEIHPDERRKAKNTVETCSRHIKKPSLRKITLNWLFIGSASCREVSMDTWSLGSASPMCHMRVPTGDKPSLAPLTQQTPSISALLWGSDPNSCIPRVGTHMGGCPGASQGTGGWQWGTLWEGVGVAKTPCTGVAAVGCDSPGDGIVPINIPVPPLHHFQPWGRVQCARPQDTIHWVI